MKIHFLPLLLLGCIISAPLSAESSAAAATAASRQPGEYPLTADSLPQAGVPRGRLEGPIEFHSQIFPGTVRRYWLFIPAQYDAARPACLLVFQDGQRATKPDGELRIPQVLENLIAKHDLPVTIGLFITPGNVSESYPDNLGTGNPGHRKEEYDMLGDRYARFLIEEMLPEVAKKYAFTADPDGRVIGGTSSGAICAFTVAWERPDQFRKVISMIGSYTSIGWRPAQNGQPAVSGGEIYPTLIRKSPVKPIRIFQQDGSNDLSNEHGDWFLANQQMASAFEFANRNADQKQDPGPRYDAKHVWGDGAHSDKQGGALLPEILRWMFRDCPK